MERPNFFDTQNVFSDDLNDICFTAGSQSVQRAQAILGASGGYGRAYSFMTGSVPRGGVFGSPADYLSNVNLNATKYNTAQILLSSGTAMDSAGNLIKVSSASLLTVGGSSSTYKWVASPNVQNYVRISYQQNSGSAKIDDYGNTFYTRLYDGYYVKVDSTLPTSNEILLSTFMADGTGAISGVVTDRRQYVRVITPSSAVMLDPTTKPVSSWASVDDHVIAVGTGTPSSTNPHGISSEDISGLTTNEHVRVQHTNGIVLNSSTTTAKNSWKASILGDNSTLRFEIPYAATASVGGHEVSSSLPDYAVKGPLGNYYICIDATGSVAQLSYTDPAFSNHGSNYMKLCAIEVYNVIGGMADDIRFITSTTDRSELTGDCRPFYTTTQDQIRLDFTEGVSAPIDLNDSNKQDTLKTNLDRIRYQLGVALTGTGSANGWKAGSPLTSGFAENADAYHSHAGTPSGYFGVNQNQTSVLPGEYRWYKGSMSTYATLHYEPLSSLFTLYDDYTTGAFAGLRLNSVTLGSGSGTTIDGGKAATLVGGAASNADALHSHIPGKVADPVLIGSTPLTAANVSTLAGGPTSNADALHTHASGSSPFHIGTSQITQAQVATLVGGTSSNADPLHTHASLTLFSTAARKIGTTNSVSGDRAVMTFYQNNSTKPMLICVYMEWDNIDPSAPVGVDIYINSTTDAGNNVLVARQGYKDADGGNYVYFSATALVPPGYYYYIKTMATTPTPGGVGNPLVAQWQVVEYV